MNSSTTPAISCFAQEGKCVNQCDIYHEKVGGVCERKRCSGINCKVDNLFFPSFCFKETSKNVSSNSHLRLSQSLSSCKYVDGCSSNLFVQNKECVSACSSYYSTSSSSSSECIPLFCEDIQYQNTTTPPSWCYVFSGNKKNIYVTDCTSERFFMKKKYKLFFFLSIRYFNDVYNSVCFDNCSSFSLESCPIHCLKDDEKCLSVCLEGFFLFIMKLIYFLRI
jgi:hypothetical protein